MKKKDIDDFIRYEHMESDLKYRLGEDQYSSPLEDILTIIAILTAIGMAAYIVFGGFSY